MSVEATRETARMAARPYNQPQYGNRSFRYPNHRFRRDLSVTFQILTCCFGISNVAATNRIWSMLVKDKPSQSITDSSRHLAYFIGRLSGLHSCTILGQSKS